jgi:hypothetical protein
MARRTRSLLIPLLLSGLLLAAPALAKTGDIARLVITSPDGEPIEILGAMLNGQLSAQERTDLYWPLLMGENKGNVAPDGDLGPAYEVTYVFRDVHDDELTVRELVYPEADPPVAFAPKGQTTELYPGDVRPVPWGWRPLPEAGVTQMFALMEEASRPPSEPYPLPFDPFLTAFFAAPVLLLVGGLWFLLRRRRGAEAS